MGDYPVWLVKPGSGMTSFQDKPEGEERTVPMSHGATWNGAVLAESDEVVRLEGTVYFPAESVNRDYLVETNRHTVPVEGPGRPLHRSGRRPHQPGCRVVLAAPVTAGPQDP